MGSNEAAVNAREFVKLILQWSADDDERAKELLTKCGLGAEEEPTQ